MNFPAIKILGIEIFLGDKNPGIFIPGMKPLILDIIGMRVYIFYL